MIIKKRRGTTSHIPYTTSWGLLRPPTQTKDTCEWIVERGNVYEPSLVQTIQGDDDIMSSSWDEAKEMLSAIDAININVDDVKTYNAFNELRSKAIASVFYARCLAIAKHYNLPSLASDTVCITFRNHGSSSHWTDPVASFVDAVQSIEVSHA